MESVEQLLQGNYVDAVYHTHVTMGDKKGKYRFDKKTMEKFWESYCENIYTKKTDLFCIAEKSQEYLPVLVDIDLKVKLDENNDGSKNLYTDEVVLQVINIFQTVLKNIVDDCTDDKLLCAVLEKPSYTIGSLNNDVEYMKNGFHLHFPHIFLSKPSHGTHLIPRIQEKLREQKVFDYLGIEDSASVYDTNYCTNPWLLYGSRKEEVMDPYTFSYAVNFSGKILNMKDAFKHYHIYDSKENPIKIRNELEKYLPRILSILPYGRPISEIKTGLISPLKEKLKEKRLKEKKHISVSVEEALVVAEKLLPMLSDIRADDRNEWMVVGWALYNIGEGCDKALELWMEFSSRSPDNYDESVCIYEWDKMIKKDLTLGTLHYYASIDNPEEYNKYKAERIEHYRQEAINGSHNGIAQMLYAEHSNEFICASFTGKIWYQYKDHHWEEIEAGIFLRKKISSEIVDRFVKMGQETFTKLGGADKPEESTISARMKLIQKLITNLKNANYKDNCMKEAAEVFYDHRFKEKIDKNPYLIGFQNGVYDLKLNEFRKGRPEDFISKRLPINYREFDESDNEIQELVHYFTKVFPDPTIRNYFLDVYCNIFVGINSMKKVFMWIGGTHGAKSITQKLFEKMLGGLSVKISTKYFTGKKGSSSEANPELARAVPPVRHLVCEEPSKKEKITTGEFKKLSGNDSFWARDLYEGGKQCREVEPMFMMTWISNNVVDLEDGGDDATWGRIRVIPFEAFFTHPNDCPKTFEEQLKQKRFPVDLKFSEKIPEMIESLAWFLLERRKKVKSIIEPERVLEATNAYKRKIDIYRQFIEEWITVDREGIMYADALYNQFKDWYKNSFPNHTLPVKNDVVEYFEKLWGTFTISRSWRGYRFKTLKDAEDAGEIIILKPDDLVNYADETGTEEIKDHRPPL